MEPKKHLVHQHFSLSHIRMKAADEGSTAPPAYEGVIYELGKSLNPSIFAESTLDSGEKVFTGAYMFADHPTAMEEWQRPERSVNDLVGRVLNAYRGEAPNGKKALLGEFFISAARPDIETKVKEGIITGLSINAYVNAVFDEDIGAWIVESFADPETDGVMPPSLDYVTHPAAGGFIAARESYRQDLLAIYQEGTIPPMLTKTTQATPPPAPVTPPVETPDPLALEVEALRESLRRRDLVEGISEQVRASLQNLPGATVARIMQAVGAHIAEFKDGKIADLPALQLAIETTVKTEKEYFVQLSRPGVPTAMSFSWNSNTDSGSMADEDELKHALEWFKQTPVGR